MSEELPFIEPLQTVAERYMLQALRFYGWNISKAAKALGIDRRTLYRAMQKNEWIGEQLDHKREVYEQSRG